MSAPFGQWTTGLCECCTDCSSCCCACWCPCIPVGEVVNVIENGQTSCFEGGLIFCLLQYFTGFGCLYTCTYRKKLRTMFDLPEDPCNDVCVDCCCLCCSIAQTYRELKNRGANFETGFVPRPTNLQPIQPINVQPPYPQTTTTYTPIQPPIGYPAPSAPQAQFMHKI